MKKLINMVAHCIATVLVIATGASSAPAPGLTRLEVIKVKSTQYATFEPIADSQLLTKQDHGGSVLTVVTEEYGYSGTEIAKFNGSRMKMTQEERLVGSNRVIYGYRRTWEYKGNFTSGKFEISASSLNFPYTTKGDWINIR